MQGKNTNHSAIFKNFRPPPFIIQLICIFICFSGVEFLKPADSQAQEGTIGDTDIELFNLSGSVTNETHGYTTTRDENRRAPLGNVTTANASFSIMGFDYSINLRYNTDDSDFRQSVNQLGFSGSWNWVRLSAGDVSPTWSNFGLRGTRIRGAHIELTPGSLILEVAAGRSRRAVDFTEEIAPSRISYERLLYGARFGYGNRSGNYFLLSGFYAKDDQDSITLPQDDNFFGSRRPSPPAENLQVSPEFQFILFDNLLQIGGEASISALTRDLRSDVIDAGEAGVPSFLTNIMEVRSSTRLGLAGSAFTRLDLDPVDLQLNYERIQPGYESLGLRTVRDDQQRYSADLGIALFNRRLQLNNSIGLHEDNLFGDRAQTQSGIDYTLDFSADVGRGISLSGGYSLNRTESGPSSPDPDIATSLFTTQNFRVQPSLNFSRNSTNHNLTLSSFYQTFESDFGNGGAGPRTDGYTLNGMAGYSITFHGGLTLNTSLNGMIGDTGGSEILNAGINTGVGYFFFNGDLTVNVSGGVSRNEVTRPAMNGGEEFQSVSWQMNGNGRISYQVTSTGSLQLSVRANNHSIRTGEGVGFSELESRLTFNQRF